jgi:hypothetical protein
MPNLTAEQVEDFWSYIDRRGPTECWPWTGYRRGNKYGLFYVGRGKQRRLYVASRLAYYISSGWFDPGEMLVCHHCDNPPCCNPAHFFLGTAKDNRDDMVGKLRHPHGDNVWWRKLSSSDVLTIKRMLALQIPKRAIARLFRVAPKSILLIGRGLMWKHIS